VGWAAAPARHLLELWTVASNLLPRRLPGRPDSSGCRRHCVASTSCSPGRCIGRIACAIGLPAGACTGRRCQYPWPRSHRCKGLRCRPLVLTVLCVVWACPCVHVCCERSMCIVFLRFAGGKKTVLGRGGLPFVRACMSAGSSNPCASLFTLWTMHAAVLLGLFYHARAEAYKQARHSPARARTRTRTSAAVAARLLQSTATTDGGTVTLVHARCSQHHGPVTTVRSLPP
jgi:hypothetical protein